ncbi:Connector enhancer of kinase suppressor of ras 2, partial [Chelonia mydas]
SFHYASLRVKTKKWSKGSSLTSGSRRRISCKDLGHGDCEGWLWKKKDAKGYFTQKWKKYWFILKDSSLYWYTNQNLTLNNLEQHILIQTLKEKRDSLKTFSSGQVYETTSNLGKQNLPRSEQSSRIAVMSTGSAASTRIPAASKHSFTVPGFKSSSLADGTPEEISCNSYISFRWTGHLIHDLTFCARKANKIRWMNRLGLAAIGYTPDDKDIRPDEDYWSESDQDDIDGSLTLKQEGPSTLCDTYHRTPSVNSSSPFPELKHGRHFSSESTYSYSSAEDSRQDATGSTHSSGCRPPYRERRSWQDLIETPLTSSGLHFLQTVPPDPEYVSGRPGMSPERRRQATLPVQRRHNHERDGPFPLVEWQRGYSSHNRPQKQRSQSLPRNRDVRGKGHVKSSGITEEKPEEKLLIKKQNNFCEEENIKEIRESTDGLQELYKSLEQASLSAFGEQRPSTKQEFRKSFVKRCNDPIINEKLHHIRVLKSTLKAKEGDLVTINNLLDDPNLTSKKFKEWKLKNYEFFLDICFVTWCTESQYHSLKFGPSDPRSIGDEGEVAGPNLSSAATLCIRTNRLAILIISMNSINYMMAKLAAIPAGLAFVSINIYAATEEESKAQSVKPNQLPIYCVPPLKSRYVEEDPGRLQVGFSTLRKTTSHYVEWCKNALVVVKFGKTFNTYVYLKNPPPEFLPKVAVITISGLTGLVLARKGSRVKKTAYPLGLATLAVSVCYPAQSVVLAKPGSHLQQVPEPAVRDDKSAEIHKTTPESEVKSKPLAVTDSSVMKIQSSKDLVPLPAEIKVPNVISGISMVLRHVAINCPQCEESWSVTPVVQPLAPQVLPSRPLHDPLFLYRLTVGTLQPLSPPSISLACPSPDPVDTYRIPRSSATERNSTLSLTVIPYHSSA